MDPIQSFGEPVNSLLPHYEEGLAFFIIEIGSLSVLARFWVDAFSLASTVLTYFHTLWQGMTLCLLGHN